MIMQASHIARQARPNNMILTAKTIILCSIIVVAKSAILDTLTRCPLKDRECHRYLFQKILHNIAKTGIEEVGIPPLDPFKLNNVSATASFDLVKLTMVDGVATGVKDCIFNSLTLEMEDQHVTMDVTCNITLKGHYTAFSDSPLLEALFGKEPVRGDGLGKIKAEKLKIRTDIDFNVEKDADGEIYLRNKKGSVGFDVDFLGKVLFYFDNLKLGGREMSKVAMSILNEADVGRSLAKTFGGAFVQKAFDFFYIFHHKFFNSVPARYYLDGDLSSYLKN